MKKMILVLALIVVLPGCSSKAFNAARETSVNAQAALATAYAKQAETNLVEIEMDEGGKLKKLVVGRQLGAAPQIAMPQDPAAQMVRDIVGGVTQVSTILAGGAAAKGVVEATGAAIGGALTAMPAPVVVEQAPPVQIPGAPAPEVVIVEPYPVPPLVIEPVIVPQE